MIQCLLSQLEARCRQRGYTLDEVRQCIVSDSGETITVDETHPAYPRHPKPGHRAGSYFVASGPGHELKVLLQKIGLHASPNCSCTAKAREMDARGCDWCESNIETIVRWLREEATKRKLPFLDMAGRLLVRRAIANARRKISETKR